MEFLEFSAQVSHTRGENVKKPTKIYVLFDDVFPTPGKGNDNLMRCKMGDGSASGYNATFEKEHLMMHFGNPEVGETLLAEHRKTFQKTRFRCNKRSPSSTRRWGYLLIVYDAAQFCIASFLTYERR